MPDHPLIGTITPARALADAGLTHDEIAAELGMSAAQVARLPELAAVRLGAPHVARVERALYEAALPGVTWKDVAVAGELQRAEAYRPADVPAGKALLAALEPQKYGTIEPVRPAPAPISVTVQFVSARGDRLDAIDVTPERDGGAGGGGMGGILDGGG